MKPVSVSPYESHKDLGEIRLEPASGRLRVELRPQTLSTIVIPVHE